MSTAVATVARREHWGGGWRIVARKEFADHVSSVRFVVLVALMSLAGLAAVHAAAGPIRDAADPASQTPSIFLYLFTLSPDRVPAFHEFLGILGPLFGIGFGFDAINGERAQRTLPRLVAQPIHRDEIINGKFVAGIGAIALALAAVMSIVGGYGALRLGVAPTPATWRESSPSTSWPSCTSRSGWRWRSCCRSCPARRHRSVDRDRDLAAVHAVRRPDRGVIADAVHSVDANSSVEQLLANARLELNIRRLSPDQLYRDATGVLLNPSRQSTGIVVTDQPAARCPSPAAQLQPACWPGGSWSRSSAARSPCSRPPTSRSCAKRCGHERHIQANERRRTIRPTRNTKTPRPLARRTHAPRPPANFPSRFHKDTPRND